MARGWGIRKPFNRHQEAYERELFEKDREAFNSLHRMQYERQNRGKVKAEPVETEKRPGAEGAAARVSGKA